MIYRKLAAVLFCSLFASVNLFAQSAHTPAAGTPEREAIMDALRVSAKKDLGRVVIFRVDRLRIAEGWAFARVAPTLPNGDEIDYSKTKYREQVELGAFDPQAEALLRYEGGEWKVLDYRFGATDLESPVWAERYRFPKSILE